ncbi:MAG: DNA-directed RNA polymerase [Candidatus Diapherotrites archaeon]|nr:DNA-directed RNA polymerase [Candidatus Diapherotrites archaeon]
MYRLVSVRDTVRVPPKNFGMELKESVAAALREQYENLIDPDIGVILAVNNVRDISPGRIIPGDGASYHDLVFDTLVFKPKLHETVRGKVNEIAQFGAFVKLGPIDGLVHVSQVTDDFISYNEKTGTLTGKESKHILKQGDEVRARVVTLSMKPTLTDSKIGLTMRQPGLGKMEWVREKKTEAVKKKVKAKKGGE